MNPFWTVTLFWTATVVSLIVALIFILPALMRARGADNKTARRDVNIAVYRDQMKEIESDRDAGLLAVEQFQIAKQELEARLAEDVLELENVPENTPAVSRKLGYALGVTLPVAAFGLYFALGNPMSLIAIAEAQANPALAAATEGQHDILKLIAQVEARTKENPEDGAAWAILAKTYAAVQHWPEALHAYEKAHKLLPDVPGIMTGYAEALAISNNRVLAGKPMELVRAALVKDPLDMKGLELAGIAAFQEQNFAKAAFYFKHLHQQLPPESPYAQDILEAQKEANRLAHAAATGMDNLADQPADAQAAGGGSISGKVDIAPALKAKLAKGDVVFLFARGKSGGAPVAAIRSTAANLPLEFELNDSMAMNSEVTLTKAQEVNLTVRVSKSGDVKPQPGDLEGSMTGVKVGAKDIRLVIDRVVQ